MVTRPPSPAMVQSVPSSLPCFGRSSFPQQIPGARPQHRWLSPACWGQGDLAALSPGPGCSLPLPTPPGLLPAPPPLHLGCSLPLPHPPGLLPASPHTSPPRLVLPSSPPRSQFNRCFPAEDIPTHQAEIPSLSPRSSRHASRRVGTWPAAPALAARDGARGRALAAPGQHPHAAGLCSRALGG